MTTTEPGWSTPSQGIFQDVLAERWRQLQKWGPQTHPDGTGASRHVRTAQAFKLLNDRREREGTEALWVDILLEEIYEAAAERGGESLREELVQSAAVIFAWIEDLDRRQFARVVEPVPVFTDQMAGVPA